MRRPKSVTYNQVAGQSSDRIEELSDGVFSIAMTLLVLDLKVPATSLVHSEEQLWRALVHLAPSLASYGLGFMTLGILWLGQSTQFSYIKRSNRGYAWIHIFFLLAVGLMPFSTSFLNAHIAYKTAVGVYYINLLMAGVSLYMSLIYAERNDLINLDADKQDDLLVMKALKRRVIYSQGLYTIGALLGLFLNTYIGIGFILLVQLNYAFGLTEGKKT